MAAFRRHYPPDEKITEKTEAIIYSFKFEPLKKESNCGQAITSLKTPDKCPACGGKNLTQDPDTLDTWFSSGLWTFSTLGWPEETADLKAYHPTTFINPGYEILFFWVARMVMMSQYLLGEIPFRTVYLHGMVRDSKGQKFSKSAKNGIEPEEVIKQYGTDALRMSMIVGVGPGSDLVFDIQKVKAYAKFANKLWNIARFVLENCPTHSDVLEGETVWKEIKKEVFDEWGIFKLIKEITEEMNNYQLYLAAEKLYDYTWHEFADRRLEEVKKILRDTDQDKKEKMGFIFNEAFENLLKLLHPFMPFVTEEIWQIMRKGKILMVEKWPIS